MQQADPVVPFGGVGDGRPQVMQIFYVAVKFLGGAVLGCRADDVTEIGITQLNQGFAQALALLR